MNNPTDRDRVTTLLHDSMFEVAPTPDSIPEALPFVRVQEICRRGGVVTMLLT